MKLLVVRFSAIGDCAMATWALSALRREGHEIDWAIEDRCAAVVSPALARRFEIARKAPAGLGQGWRKRTGAFAPLLRAVRSLRLERYPVGIDLQGHAKTALLLRLSGARRRYVLNPRDPLARRLATPIDSHEPHEVLRAADGLRGALLGDALVEAETPLPIMPVAPSAERRLALVAVAAGTLDKALPPTSATAVARALVKDGWRVEMIGGPTDSAPADLGGAVDRVGAMTLAETVSRIGAASLVVAGDTGAGHIAAAYGVPSVSVFGPTDPERYRPWGARATVLQNGLTPDSVTPDEILSAASEAMACAF